MSFNDVLGIGKIFPLDKLVDMVSKTTFRLTKQYFDKKDTDSKAYEIKKITEARAAELKTMSDAIARAAKKLGAVEYQTDGLKLSNISNSINPRISTLPNGQLTDRTADRLMVTQAKRQLNIEAITSSAAEQLKDEPPVENQPLDEDWIARFLNYAEDIGNEEMQHLWGKILAGEIKQPRTFSLRTLDVVRNLSKEDANAIMKVSNLAFMSANYPVLFRGVYSDTLTKYGLSIQVIELMKELNILQPTDIAAIILPANNPEIDIKPFVFGKTLMLVTRDANASKQNIPIYLFSNVGKEILKLIDVSPPFEYLKELASHLKSSDTKVQYGEINKIEGNLIDYGELQEF